MLNRIPHLLAGGFVATALISAAPLGGAWAEEQQLRQELPQYFGTLVRPQADGALMRHDRARRGAGAGAGLLGSNRSIGTTDYDPSFDDDSPIFEGRGLEVIQRGVRLERDATTDVWAHEDFAYTGTFNVPCGGNPGAGVWVWDLDDDQAHVVTVIASPVGSRVNDVKVAAMNSGDILVHSNESCSGGPGGFEIYNVNDPPSPIHLASVRIDELNPVSDDFFGGLTDVGVHNLWLFTQEDRDYVGLASNGAFDNFRIYDITDPTNPTLASGWGAEEIFDPGVGDSADVSRVGDAVNWLLDGFGDSTNRFLHDITGTDDGTQMYLSNWDAGLVLLDISDPTNPQLVSVALDEVNGSLDGEVNSHAAWPSEDGSIVVEGEEDFDAWQGTAPPGNLTFRDRLTNVIPGTAIATVSGDAFEVPANQTSNTGTVDGPRVTVTNGPLAGQFFHAIELAGSQPKFAGTGPVPGDFVWIGRACNGDTLVNPLTTGDIAVVRRGACAFSEKLNTAATNNAAAIVIANNRTVTNQWSGMRIWDYSDPANPVLASTFNTACSASLAPSAECNVIGTYSVHNVIVETDDEDDDDGEGRVKAYISWYSDGVLVLDVTDPYDPIEIARYNQTGAAFEAHNGGIQDVWGIYKVPGEEEIYASDRNGGLYVLEQTDDAFELASD